MYFRIVQIRQASKILLSSYLTFFIGMNHSAEAYCQSLVSVGQCLRIIGDTNTPFSVRAAYCRFLDEVHNKFNIVLRVFLTLFLRCTLTLRRQSLLLSCCIKTIDSGLYCLKRFLKC